MRFLRIFLTACTFLSGGEEGLCFVSLGSTCQPAHLLREMGIREEAFPFDWITTIDSQKFIEILQENFLHFLDDASLYPVPKDPGPLLNTRYHLEFLHEGDFRGASYLPNLEKLKEKYLRRIDRFRRLAEHKGKVVFMRCSFQYSTTDPHRVYFCKENLEVSDEYALRLREALKTFFPKLDFVLLIINDHDQESLFEEKRIGDEIIKIRVNPNLELAPKAKLLKDYLAAEFN